MDARPQKTARMWISPLLAEQLIAQNPGSGTLLRCAIPSRGVRQFLQRAVDGLFGERTNAFDVGGEHALQTDGRVWSALKASGRVGLETDPADLATLHLAPDVAALVSAEWRPAVLAGRMTPTEAIARALRIYGATEWRSAVKIVVGDRDGRIEDGSHRLAGARISGDIVAAVKVRDLEASEQDARYHQARDDLANPKQETMRDLENLVDRGYLEVACAAAQALQGVHWRLGDRAASDHYQLESLILARQHNHPELELHVLRDMLANSWADPENYPLSNVLQAAAQSVHQGVYAWVATATQPPAVSSDGVAGQRGGEAVLAS